MKSLAKKLFVLVCLTGLVSPAFATYYWIGLDFVIRNKTKYDQTLKLERQIGQSWNDIGPIYTELYNGSNVRISDVRRNDGNWTQTGFTDLDYANYERGILLHPKGKAGSEIKRTPQYAWRNEGNWYKTTYNTRILGPRGESTCTVTVDVYSQGKAVNTMYAEAKNISKSGDFCKAEIVYDEGAFYWNGWGYSKVEGRDSYRVYIDIIDPNEKKS